MKLAVSFVIVALATIVYGRPGETYTTKYDNIDVDAIIESDRLMDSYIDCLLGKGKCTPEGAELKKQIQDALQTCCSKCSPVQEHKSKKILKHMENKKHEALNELKQKYDPTGENEAKCKPKL